MVTCLHQIHGELPGVTLKVNILRQGWDIIERVIYKRTPLCACVHVRDKQIYDFIESLFVECCHHDPIGLLNHAHTA